MKDFLRSISPEIAISIAFAMVVIANVWSGVKVTKIFYKERRFIRLGFCYACYLALIIIIGYQWWGVIK